MWLMGLDYGHFPENLYIHQFNENLGRNLWEKDIQKCEFVILAMVGESGQVRACNFGA